MIELMVELGERAYPILIGTGLLGDRALVGRAIGARQVMVVTNEVVGPLYAHQLMAGLEGREVRCISLPDGEAHKDLASFERIMTALLEARFERGCCVVALGGGVVGDIAGFAAACYQRGVDFVQVPTTLLAQVDSSVGGKTAVNHPLGKNMIGAFYQPRAVLADLATLDTLPDRELRAGLAEVIKYGLLGDRDFLEWLERNLARLLRRDPAATAFAVERSCRNKAAIVVADEREANIRALLNLGHTFGHGIEHALGYGNWLHGEAVGAGMCMAARMSCRLGFIDTAACMRVVELVRRAGLPTGRPRHVDPEALYSAMLVDKKNKEGRIRLVLFRALGDAMLCDTYDPQALQETLAEAEAFDGADER